LTHTPSWQNHVAKLKTFKNETNPKVAETLTFFSKAFIQSGNSRDEKEREQSKSKRQPNKLLAVRCR